MYSGGIFIQYVIQENQLGAELGIRTCGFVNKEIGILTIAKEQ